MQLDLDDACAALALAAARPAPTARLVVARHADLWRHVLRQPLDPLDAVLPIGALSTDAQHLLALLVECAHRVATMQVIAVTAAAHRGPRAVFVDVAARLAPRLPPAVVRETAIRQQELLRRWADAHGAGVRHEGRDEPDDLRRRVLDRLDYHRIRAEEQRLDEQRTIAEAHREAMRKIASGAPL